MPTNNQIAEYGITGCGGAGFPTHVKLSAQNIDALIVNAAECEPLLHKDKAILQHYTQDFFNGLMSAIAITNAKRAYIGIKKKYSSLIAHLRPFITDPKVSILELGDFYPAGDEYELVYEATGKLIPLGGIPLNIGCVVLNVETLLNISKKAPMITKFLTIAGAVPNPCTLELPLGVSVIEALSLAGLNSVDGLTIIDGGPMMGKIINDPHSAVITKSCGGLIALPNEHVLIKKMTRPENHNKRIARSACDQCTDCSELCPRALLGYPVRPHKAMRTAQLAVFEQNKYSVDSIFCSECGLCSLFACPEDLPPREITILSKNSHLKNGVKPSDFKIELKPNPMRSHRRVTIDRLIKKLGLLNYSKDAPLTQISQSFDQVRLPLKMHIGMPASPIVKPGDRVKAGQLIAAIPNDKLAANLHASISGQVLSVDDKHIVITRK